MVHVGKYSSPMDPMAMTFDNILVDGGDRMNCFMVV